MPSLMLSNSKSSRRQHQALYRMTVSQPQKTRFLQLKTTTHRRTRITGENNLLMLKVVMMTIKGMIKAMDNMIMEMGPEMNRKNRQVDRVDKVERDRVGALPSRR